MVSVCLLGCGGSLPSSNRYLTSLLVEVNGRKILIDCGEGTQVSMKIQNTGFKDIDVICFTHYHADHVAGLPGLLLTIANSGRVEPITIVGPTGLDRVIEGLTVITPWLPFELKLTEISESENEVGRLTTNLLEENNTYIEWTHGDHSTLCLAYTVNVTRHREFDANKAKQLNIPMQYWKILQKGVAVDSYTPDMVLGKQRRGLKIAYSTDTRPTRNLVQLVRDSDLLVCEGMYGSEEDLPKALRNKHMLFSEAATIALEAEVSELWLTHFSPSLTEPQDYISNATDIFKNTAVGEDRKSKCLKFEQ